MNTATGTTPEHVASAVEAVRKIKPGYGRMLDLYEKIFIEQENSKRGIRVAEYLIPDDALSVIQKEKFPLIDVSRFIIDAEAAGQLFGRICGILLEAGDGISESAGRMRDAVDNGPLDTGKLFSGYLSDSDALLDSLIKELNIDREVARFAIFNSLKPSLSIFSRSLSVYLDAESEWEKGFCPVCGSGPELSLLVENGKRSMICGFCEHQWLTKRVFCPFCGNRDHQSLDYYNIEGEEEYRVDVCNGCKSYIKTVDVRKLSRPVYVPLESAATTYIDMKFQEMGYRTGNAVSDN